MLDFSVGEIVENEIYLAEHYRWMDARLTRASRWIAFGPHWRTIRPWTGADFSLALPAVEAIANHVNGAV